MNCTLVSSPHWSHRSADLTLGPNASFRNFRSAIATEIWKERWIRVRDQGARRGLYYRIALIEPDAQWQEGRRRDLQRGHRQNIVSLSRAYMLCMYLCCSPEVMVYVCDCAVE